MDPVSEQQKTASPELAVGFQSSGQRPIAASFFADSVSKIRRILRFLRQAEEKLQPDALHRRQARARIAKETRADRPTELSSPTVSVILNNC